LRYYCRCLILAPDWPTAVVVNSWEVPDLARRVRAVQDDFDHTVIDSARSARRSCARR
jgi:hypothetical protein